MCRPVLIIEDHPQVRNGQARLLERRGIDCVCCETLAQGLELAGQQEFACCILDLGLPDSDAHETVAAIPQLLATLQQSAGGGTVPLIASTGVEDQQLVRAAMAAGSFAILTKGSSAGTLVEKVRSAMIVHDPDDVESAQDIFANRRDNYHYSPYSRFLAWLTQAKAMAALIIAMVTTGGTLIFGVMHYGQSVRDYFARQATDNLLFKQQMDANTATGAANATAILALGNRVTVVENRADIASTDRQQLTRRGDAVQNGMDELKRSMDDHFARLQSAQTDIYKILIERDRKQP